MKTQHRQLTQSLGFSTPNKPIRFFFALGMLCLIGNAQKKQRPPEKQVATG